MERFFETTKIYGDSITGTVPGLRKVPRRADLAAPFVTNRPGIESAGAVGERTRSITMEGGSAIDLRYSDRTVRKRRDGCLKAISEYPLRMTLSWDELRESTREP